MEEMEVYEPRQAIKPLTAQEIKANVQLIQEVMKAVMVDGHHYGTIPGTPKPTLYKPGSEKLLSTFRIAAYPKKIIDLSTMDEVRYQVEVHGICQSTGVLLGVGIGECSSGEEKYKWRKPVCDAEYNETPEDRKREVWKNQYGKIQKIKQVRTNPSDVANTILKMAKKRAQIDMTLTVTAASDIFEQDLEDMPEELRETTETKSKVKDPEPSKPPVLMASEAQIKAIHTILSTKAPDTDHCLWVNECLGLIGKPEELEHVSIETITKDYAKKLFDNFEMLKWTKAKEETKA